MSDPRSAATLPSRSDFLTARHGIINVAHVLATHVLLVAWFALAWPLLPVTIYVPLSVVASLIHQRAMSEWIHEGSHHNLVPDMTWNDRLTDALVSVWFGVTVASYRSTHFPHHAKDEFFREGDPDTDFLDVSSRREFWWAVLRDLTGRAILRHFRRFEANASQRRSLAPLLATAVLQLALMTVLFELGRLDAYIVYYATLCTFYPLLNRLRVYGQHVSPGARPEKGFAGSAVSRTIDAGWLDRVLWTSPRLLYHYEHHAYPGLPYRALPALCDRSSDRDVYAKSRWAVLREVYASLPPS